MDVCPDLHAMCRGVSYWWFVEHRADMSLDVFGCDSDTRISRTTATFPVVHADCRDTCIRSEVGIRDGILRSKLKPLNAVARRCSCCA